MKNQLNILFALILSVFSLSLISEPILSSLSTSSCTTADKRNILYHSNASFAIKWEQCGRAAWGDSAQTAACLVQAFPALSKSCSNCFGEHAACSSSNCKWACLFGSADSCEQCSRQYCEAALSVCTGITPADLPSKY